MNLQKIPPPLAAARPTLSAVRRFIRYRRAGDHSKLYCVYVAVLCAAFLGVPGIFSLVGVVSLIGQAVGPAVVVASLHAAGAVFVALTAFMPSHAGLVIPTACELFYFVAGPFGVRGTLAPRTLMLFLIVTASGGLAAGVAVAGLGLWGWTAVGTVASGLGLGGIAAGSLVVLQSVTAAIGRWGFAAAGVLLAAASSWFGVTVVFPLAVSVLEFAAAVVLCAFVPAFLDSVRVAQLEADIASRAVLLAGLMAGDARPFGSTRTGRPRSFRRSRMSFPRGPWLRALRVDALSVLRTPVRTAAAVLAGASSGALITATNGNLVAVAVALVVLERVFRVLAKGLLDYLDTVGADRIAPDPFWWTVLQHIVLPWTLLILCTCAGALAAAPIVHAGTLAAGALGLVLTAPPCVSMMLSGSAGTPVSMLAPVLTPMGDASSLALVLWMLRGFVPACLFTLVALNAGPAAGTAVVIPGCAAMALLQLRNLRRVEDNAAGHAWRRR